VGDRIQNGRSAGLSPGAELKLKHEEARRTKAYAELAGALVRGEVFGENVGRLHGMIGGSLDELQHAELELALHRMIAMKHQMAARAIAQTR
jgi:hypothetical protein